MLTQERLKELLEYNPDTGDFVRKTTYVRVRAGDKAGGLNQRGYIEIRVLGKKYLAHRLAWLYVNGVFPEMDIDHINGNTQDNRISNLRLITISGNNQNRRRSRKDSSSEYLGISIKHQKDKTKWQVRIQIEGVRFYLGLFNTEEEAYEVYLENKRKYHKFNTL